MTKSYYIKDEWRTKTRKSGEKNVLNESLVNLITFLLLIRGSSPWIDIRL